MENEDTIVKLIIKYSLKHPEYLLFVDEDRDNLHNDSNKMQIVSSILCPREANMLLYAGTIMILDLVFLALLLLLIIL